MLKKKNRVRVLSGFDSGFQCCFWQHSETTKQQTLTSHRGRLPHISAQKTAYTTTKNNLLNTSNHPKTHPPPPPKKKKKTSKKLLPCYIFLPLPSSKPRTLLPRFPPGEGDTKGLGRGHQWLGAEGALVPRSVRPVFFGRWSWSEGNKTPEKKG